MGFNNLESYLLSPDKQVKELFNEVITALYERPHLHNYGIQKDEHTMNLNNTKIDLSGMPQALRHMAVMRYSAGGKPPKHIRRSYYVRQADGTVIPVYKSQFDRVKNIPIEVDISSESYCNVSPSAVGVGDVITGGASDKGAIPSTIDSQAWIVRYVGEQLIYMESAGNTREGERVRANVMDRSKDRIVKVLTFHVTFRTIRDYTSAEAAYKEFMGTMCSTYAVVPFDDLRQVDRDAWFDKVHGLTQNNL